MAYHCKNKWHEGQDCTYCSTIRTSIELEDVHSWIMCPACSDLNRTITHHCQNDKHRHKECQLCPATGYIQSFDTHYWVKCIMCSKAHENELKLFYEKIATADQEYKTQYNEDSQVTSDRQEESKHQEESTTSKYKCKYCDMILESGIDDNDMLHCQLCHNIYDGNAQCQCN